MTIDSPADSATEAQIAAAIARCATGEQTALRVIYDIEAPRMVGVARRILRRQDLAEEAVQDAFMRVWRGGPPLAPPQGGRPARSIRRRARRAPGSMPSCAIARCRSFATRAASSATTTSSKTQPRR